ncbi:MAG: alginate lyase family protein, partial [Candidatus Latescibacteria bacterium]|nr:alginate lyase family protein [Candidatus Latescibacterota bacterium]
SGIYNVGAYFPELKEAENLRTFAEQAMEATLEDEFYPDTISKELCPGYHGTSRHAVRRLVDSAILMGYKPSPILMDGLTAIYDFYPKVATPLGGIPHFGDTGVSNKDMLSKTFLDIIDLIDNPVYRWFATQQQEGHPPNFTSTHLPWAGFYVMRSGWDQNAMYLCLDAGPLGKGHWHEDLLNFECYAYGEPLVSEVGVYSYVTDAWSGYFRSTHAHNTVIVDNMGQIRTGSAPLEIDTPRENDWHSDDVFDLAWGLYEGQWSSDPAAPGHTAPEVSTIAVDAITHRRDICFVKNSYWIISDRLTASGEHTYSQLFHFQPDRNLKILNNHQTETTNANRANVAFIQADPVEAIIITGREEPLQGWYSAGQREKQPAPVLSFDQIKTDTARYDTVMLPLAKGQTAHISVKRINVTEAGNTISPDLICALHIQTEQGIDLYLNDLRQSEIGTLNGQSKQIGDLETDARAVVIRLDTDGTFKTASAIGATFMTYKGQDIAF